MVERTVSRLLKIICLTGFISTAAAGAAIALTPNEYKSVPRNVATAAALITGAAIIGEAYDNSRRTEYLSNIPSGRRGELRRMDQD